MPPNAKHEIRNHFNSIWGWLISDIWRISFPFLAAKSGSELWLEMLRKVILEETKKDIGCSRPFTEIKQMIEVLGTNKNKPNWPSAPEGTVSRHI